MGRYGLIGLLVAGLAPAAELPVRKVVLYGSYANGTATADSDVDLAVITPAFAHRKEGMRFLFHRAKPISVDLEPIPVLPEVFDDPPRTSFAFEIKRTGVVIYDEQQGGLLI